MELAGWQLINQGPSTYLNMSTKQKNFLCLLSLTFFISCASQGPETLKYSKVTNGVQTLSLQDPISPQQTLSRLETPEGFSVRVFASEPHIVNPIALTWDERGRLWVLESTNYPHRYIGTEKGGDRITICEDTDGDGVADKYIRFAEEQPLSTAITIVKGGALVGQAPDIVFMEDTDGDDVFDSKKKVIENAFGSWDTHAVMNNFKYGIDNRIWSAVGYSGLYKPGMAPPPGQRPRSDDGKILPMGVFRFSRDGSVIEPVGRFNNNTWGLGISEDNTIFGSTANNNHAITIPIPMRYDAEKNVANIQSHFIMKHSATGNPWQVDYRDGYTAAAGLFLYNGRRYPERYWGAGLLNEPTGHVLHTTFFEPSGSTYKEVSGDPENLLASSDDWVAPVFADIGPDENVWVADWHNPVIQHNPDGRGMINQIWNAEKGEGNAHQNPLRDVQHGRVYVIQYPGEDGISSLDPTDKEGLIEALKSTNQFWRLTAQRLIVENEVDVMDELLDLIKDKSMDSRRLNVAAIHAIWTIDGLGRSGEVVSQLKQALKHPSSGVRKAALQVLPDSEWRSFVDLVQDSDLGLRLAAVLRVADMDVELAESLKRATQTARQGGDEWLDAAADLFVEKEPGGTVASGKARTPSAMTAHLTINTNPSEMSYQQKTISAFEGQSLELTFNNLHPDLHNVVLLKSGADIESFGAELDGYISNADSKSTNYIPESQNSTVLLSSEVIGLNASQTLSIDALEPGEYVYICTVPGHWRTMQGVLKIEAMP